MPISQSYKNIQIVDYFPKEIIDNFDFAYVEKANIGEISAKVDTQIIQLHGLFQNLLVVKLLLFNTN